MIPHGAEDRLRTDASVPLGRAKFRLRGASLSLTLHLLIFSLRYLVQVNVLDPDTLVVARSPMITAVEKHTIPESLVEIPTALERRRKRYPNYYTTGARG